MKKLSSGDPLTTHRELYLRNVSSKELHFNGSEEEPEKDQPPATRQQGDVITFDRYASIPSWTERAVSMLFPLLGSPADPHDSTTVHSCQRCCNGKS